MSERAPSFITWHDILSRVREWRVADIVQQCGQPHKLPITGNLLIVVTKRFRPFSVDDFEEPRGYLKRPQ